MFGFSFSKSYPLNKILISKEQLIANYQYLASLQEGVAVGPVLKSNAYGHGIKEVGKIIDTQKPPFICVDSLYEAFQLQKVGIKSEILITGYIDPRSLQGKKLPFSYTVFDLDQLKNIAKYQPGARGLPDDIQK
jgi:alanine racemase